MSGSICDFARFMSLPMTGRCALSRVGISFIAAVSSPFGPVIEAEISATSVLVFAAGRAAFALAKISLILSSMSVENFSFEKARASHAERAFKLVQSIFSGPNRQAFFAALPVIVSGNFLECFSARLLLRDKGENPERTFARERQNICRRLAVIPAR